MRACQRRMALYAALKSFLLIYVCCAVFLKQEPFPYFNWDLYSGNPHVVTTYEVMITALKPDEKLKTPVSLHEITPAFHRDWNPQPTKIIRRFGYLADQLNAGSTIGYQGTAANIVQAYYAPMPATKPALQTARALVENYMQDLPYVEYDLVRITFKPLDYVKNKIPLSYTVVGSYTKGAP